MNVSLGVLLGIASTTLFMAITGWPRAIGRDDAVGLALAILIFVPLQMYFQRRRWQWFIEQLEDIRALYARAAR